MPPKLTFLLYLNCRYQARTGPRSTWTTQRSWISSGWRSPTSGRRKFLEVSSSQRGVTLTKRRTKEKSDSMKRLFLFDIKLVKQFSLNRLADYIEHTCGLLQHRKFAQWHNKVCHFFKWANPGLFLFIVLLFTFQFKWQIYKLNNLNWKKCGWCAGGSILGRQDGRRRRIHWAIAASLKILLNKKYTPFCWWASVLAVFWYNRF